MWRTEKGARGAIFGGDGKRIKSLEIGSKADDSMPSISALSHTGFVVAQRTVVNGAGVLKVQLFFNNGSAIRPEFDAQFTSVYGEPQVTGISEDRFVVQALDRFSKLTVSVFWQDKRINNFEVTSNVHSWKTVPLSGDSYVIIVRDKADTVRLFAFRANSQQKYTIDPLEVEGYIAKKVEDFDVIALPNNHFTVAVFFTPNISISTFNFKDAEKLRDDGQQGNVPITSPQPRSNVLQVKDATTNGVLSRRGNGFAFTYRATDLSAKIAVFKNLGVANSTTFVVDDGPGPQKAGPRIVGKANNGFAVSFLREDGTSGVKWLSQADFGELAQETTSAGRKRQPVTGTPAATTPASSAAATTTTTPASSAAATTTPAATAAATTTTTAAPTTTTTVAASTTTTPATSAGASQLPTTPESTGAPTTTAPATTKAAGADVVATTPVLFALANGNIVELTLTEATPTSGGEDEDDDDESARLNCKFKVYTPEGEVVTKGDVVTDGSVVSLGEVFRAQTGAAGTVAIAALSMLVAMVAALA